MVDGTIPENKSIVDVQIDDYKFKASTDVADDVDTLELMDDIQAGRNLSGIVTLVKKSMGDKEYEAMKAHFVKKDGRLSITKLQTVIEKLFESIGPKD